jgi:hypothetical protein
VYIFNLANNNRISYYTVLGINLEHPYSLLWPTDPVFWLFIGTDLTNY